MKSIQPRSSHDRVNVYLNEETKIWLIAQTQRLNMSQSQFVALLLDKLRRERDSVTLKDLA